jgi:hypothetical protein
MGAKHFRFSPVVGHLEHAGLLLSCANFGLMHCNMDWSFDHPVGSHLQSQWDCKPKRLGGFEVYTSSNLVGCMTGMSAGFSPLRIRPV